MSEIKINICQVSLNCNIPLIIENYNNFKKFYKNIKIFIICPDSQINEFKKKINFAEIKIIREEEIIQFKKFETIYKTLSKEINYEEQFNKRLKWYYQQILKMTFSFNFIKKNNENIIIWDADTIILKKINFFKEDTSVKYCNFFEFHKAYYMTNEYILKNLPTYFKSSLNQFIAITKSEGNFFLENFLNHRSKDVPLGEKITELVFESIFNKHKIYNGSLFSEYELIGQSNYLFKKEKQKPILFLRFELDGILNETQKFIVKLFGYKHVTYEHANPNDKNHGMLNRFQSWKGLFKILLKNLIKFYLRYLRHILIYNLYKTK